MQSNSYKWFHNNEINSLEIYISNELNLLAKIENKYILKKVIENIKKDKLHKIIKYKQIRLNINKNDY